MLGWVDYEILFFIISRPDVASSWETVSFMDTGYENYRKHLATAKIIVSVLKLKNISFQYIE